MSEITVTAHTVPADQAPDLINSRTPQGTWWHLSRLGETVFAPPIPIEGADFTDEMLQKIDADQATYVAVTVRFGAGSGVDSHGMVCVSVDPRDVIHLLRSTLD